MIKVSIWNEYVQEQLDKKRFPFMEQWNCPEEVWQRFSDNAELIRSIHGEGIHETLRSLAEEDPNIIVRHIGTLEMENCGITEEILLDTDVLIWWSHFAQEQVPDETARLVQDHVLRGMGLIVLHSGHMSKPLRFLLGTSCTLRWREGDREQLWCTAPRHPIARGIDPVVKLDEEEMYGEFFDIPDPDELVFIAGFSGGEVFRAGCIWRRGYGKVFYFQPGHETCRSYLNPQIRQIIRNGIHYVAQPGFRAEKLECLAV